MLAEAEVQAFYKRRLDLPAAGRQYLLDRAPAWAIDAIEHLGGMQSQAPLAPYVIALSVASGGRSRRIPRRFGR